MNTLISLEQTEAYPYVMFPEDNSIRFYSDFSVWEGVPSDRKFYPIDGSSNPKDFITLVANGYGILKNNKYGLKGEYGSGSISVPNDLFSEEVIEWASKWVDRFNLISKLESSLNKLNSAFLKQFSHRFEDSGSGNLIVVLNDLEYIMNATSFYSLEKDDIDTFFSVENFNPENLIKFGFTEESVLNNRGHHSMRSLNLV